MIKNIKEVIRYSRSIYNRAKSSDLLTEDDLADHSRGKKAKKFDHGILK